jgi:hypothetical protein
LPTACALPLKLKKGTFGESRWELKTTSYITGFLMSRYQVVAAQSGLGAMSEFNLQCAPKRASDGGY